MRFEPHRYQDFCIREMLDRPKLALFLDMGLGKSVITLTALWALIYDSFEVAKVLIIAPKKVAEGTWNAEQQKWDHLQQLRIVNIAGNMKERQTALRKDADIYIISRDNVVWLTEYVKNRWDFDTVVIDESSSFKNHQSKRFRALARELPRIKRLYELTGTPSPNGLMDLWAQIYLLDKGEALGRTIGQYRERYFEPDKRNRTVIWSYKLKKGADRAIQDKIKGLTISMQAADYIELPAIVYQDIPVYLDTAARKVYEDMERDMVLELPDEDITATSAAALTNKLLQLASGAIYTEEGETKEIHDCKIDAFLELIEGLQGKAALVFYNFRSDERRIREALKGSGLRVRKLESAEDQKAWNAQQVDILLAHPASAAYGLNLQDGGNHVIWFGLSWNLEQYKQANARLHRQGQKNVVIVHHLITQDTRDDDVMRALRSKGNMQDELLHSLKAISDKHRSKPRKLAEKVK